MDVSAANNKNQPEKIPIDWPPTRQSFMRLCKQLNLKISMKRSLDAILFCRGAKMENAPPESFSLNKLVQWFLLNQKVLEHENLEKAD